MGVVHAGCGCWVGRYRVHLVCSAPDLRSRELVWDSEGGKSGTAAVRGGKPGCGVAATFNVSTSDAREGKPEPVAVGIQSAIR